MRKSKLEPLVPQAIATALGVREEAGQGLAATLVTVAIAVPLLLIAALIEVYVSPHLFTTLTGIHPPIVREVAGMIVQDRVK